jgi:geranylgeranyl pyrophosphate synthase
MGYSNGGNGQMTWAMFQEKLGEKRAKWASCGIPAVAGEMLVSQGKEWRARLVFLTAQLLGPVTPAHEALACAIECVHTASLLHDDVLDQGNLRRGRPCTHRVWGNTVAILSGDWWLAKGFSILLQVGNLDVIARVQRATIQLVQGQLADCQMTYQASRSAYLTMIEDKTACLFAVAAAASGMLSGASLGQITALEAYGKGVGMAYQLRDDACEYGESPENWHMGHDFFQKKTTCPVVMMGEPGHEGAYIDFLSIQKKVVRLIDQGECSSQDERFPVGLVPELAPWLEKVHLGIKPFVDGTLALANGYTACALGGLDSLWPKDETRDFVEYSYF